VLFRSSLFRNAVAPEQFATDVRKLKSTDGEYLWSNGNQFGQPDLINGKPLFVNNDMASVMATAAVSVLFGDLAKYAQKQDGSSRTGLVGL